MEIIDLRSDTVTRPTPAMRRAMAEAEVGDDVYGEDPTVNRLESMAAERMGKEAGLLVSSGTMGNLIAILTHCGRGDEVIMGTLAHTFLYEAGGISALGGVHPHTVPNQSDGTLDINDIKAAIRPDDVHAPVSRLVVLENTQNRCGGVPITAVYTREAAELAHSHDMACHLDGARIFNAAAALDTPVLDLVSAVDSVTFCLSKGLCAPVGSLLCGPKPFIRKARRIRKQLGGGMRQAGILAAAGIVALQEMTDHLKDDHRRARKISQGLGQMQGISLKYQTPPSNMIFFNLDEQTTQSDEIFISRLKENGILIGRIGARQFRIVTHYWIDDQAVEKAISVIKSILEG